jgi:hypothetical protein
MDSTGPPVAPTALYTNVAYPAAKPPSSTSSRPPHDGNGGNRTKYTNKNHNSGNSGGHNGKNSTDDGGRGVSSRQTTAPLVPTIGPTHRGRPTATRGRGHMTMYPGSCARWTAVSAGFRGHTRPQHVSRPPVRATAAAAAAAVPASRPGPRMEPLARCKLGPVVAGQLLQHHDAPPASYLSPGLGGRLWRDAPHHSIS